MSDFADSIPGYRDALRREKEARESAGLGLPSVICGLAIRPMTFLDFIRLCAMRSPFVSGGHIRREDCVRLLCYMAEGFCAPEANLGSRWRAYRHRARVMAALRKVHSDQMVVEIDQYLDAVFLDAPGGGSGADSTPIASQAAAIIDSVASAYGWTVREIESLELAFIFQLRRCRDRSEMGRRFVAINRISDRVRGEYLRNLNKN